MRCGACEFVNPAGFNFCGSCGAPLPRVCASCGADVSEDSRVCHNCGRPLTGPHPDPARLPSGDRRRVTVLFADLVGYSSFAEQLDPEELQVEMTETFEHLAALVEERGGVVEKFIGDAIVAIFGAPVAHEDDPLRAVEVAVRMQETLAARTRDSRTPPLRLRIGINTGLVVSRPPSGRDGSNTGVIGDAVNVAARLQQAAAPGEVLVADTTFRRVQHDFSLSHVGLMEVKGRNQPVDTYRIETRRPSPVRTHTPFVGRHEELSLLELLWSNVSKGNTHVVSLVGDPGVGKTRLLEEWPRRTNGRDVRVTCSGRGAYGPWLDSIGKLLGDVPGDLHELRERVSAINIHDEEATDLLAAFLGLKGAPPVVRMADEQQKRQVFAGVWRFLTAASADRPLLLVLDDLNWADKSTLDLLGFILERLSATPVLLLLTYRAGFEQAVSIHPRASHTAVRLELLDHQESSALARGYLRVASLPLDLEQIVTSRAEGNAFFIEELLRALLELGSLTIEDGIAALADADIIIPDTIEGTILARADRLSGPARNVLDHAAVIGRTCTTGLLEAVLETSTDDSLRSLALAQLIVPTGEETWTFKHALIQEVIYDTLLKRHRKEIHRRVAEALEKSAGDEPGFLDALAEHYSRADVPVKARTYAMAAGDLARDRLGYAEATLRYQTALRLWGEGNETGRLELLDKLGATASLGSDPSTAKRALLESTAAWKARGDDARAGSSLALLGRVLWSGGESDRAADALEEAISLLEPSGPSDGLLQVHVWRSSLLMLDAQTLEAIDVARRGLEIEEAVDHPGFRSQLLNTLGVCASDLGDPAGVDQLREALRLAESSGDAEAIARAYVNLPSVLDDLFERREAVEVCRRGRATVHKIGSPSYESFIAGNEARSLMGLGQLSEAEELARNTLAVERSLSSPPGIVSAGNVLGAVLFRTGRYDEARTVYEDIQGPARRLGGTDFLGRLLVDIAELEETRGNSAVASSILDEALHLIENVSSLFHVALLLPAIARMSPRAGPRLLAQCRSGTRLASWQACLHEAEGWVTHDAQSFLQAAQLYRRFESPYEEARCRLEGGDLSAAGKLIELFGLEGGPLGERMRALRYKEYGNGVETTHAFTDRK